LLSLGQQDSFSHGISARLGEYSSLSWVHSTDGIVEWHNDNRLSLHRGGLAHQL